MGFDAFGKAAREHLLRLSLHLESNSILALGMKSQNETL
jgi:hypothetical protein